MTRSIDIARFREKLIALTALFKQGKYEECRVQCEALAKQFPKEPTTAKKMYRDSSSEWRKYEKHLESMVEALRGY